MTNGPLSETELQKLHLQYAGEMGGASVLLVLIGNLGENKKHFTADVKVQSIK